MIGPLAMKIALTQVGVKEKTNRNDGVEVEKYLRSVKLGKGYSWCGAFVYWCAEQAAAQLNVPNPLMSTGGVLAQWNARQELHVKTPAAGDVFIIDYGNGLGHTGFVVRVRGELVDTIEGNTNSGGSRDGDGVYRRIRKIVNMRGFLRI